MPPSPGATPSATTSRGARRRTSTGRFRLLPADRRRSMSALYAFMRHTDDLADEPGEPAAKAESLRRWRSDLDAALGGRPDAWPGLPALADTVARRGDPRRASPRGHRRRRDGPDAAGLCDVRRAVWLLLSRRVGRRPLLPADLGVFLRRRPCRVDGRGVRRRAPTDEHPPRRRRGRPERAGLLAPGRAGAVRRLGRRLDGCGPLRRGRGPCSNPRRAAPIRITRRPHP